MKHNLPAPSQAWGSDIDRRLANLESAMRVQDNKLVNSADTLRSLVQNSTTNSGGQPFDITDTQAGLYFNDDPAHSGSNVYTRQLSWADGGSHMLVIVSGFIEIRLQDSITPSTTLFKVHSAINGKGIIGTSVMVPTYGGHTLGATISGSTLIEYNKVHDPQVLISVAGYNPNNYLVNGSPTSSLTISISGVRY